MSRFSQLFALQLCVSLFCVPFASLRAAEVDVELVEISGKHYFRVQGLPKINTDQLSKFFAVYVGNASEPMLGTYQLRGGGVAFVPRFPLSTDLEYQLRFSDKLKRPEVAGKRFTFSVAQPGKAVAAEVSAVYPSANLLPENLLKFYIYFSKSMKRGEAYRHIQLLQGERVVEDAFLELGEELWDGEQKRFTLFVHPGRIKRGVKPNEDKGPALERGREYILRIASDWSAADGATLEKPFVKRFRVADPDHEQPQPHKWKIVSPGKGSKEPLQLTFIEPLDYAMLNRVLVIHNGLGEEVEGRVEVSDNETKWSFTPEKPWAAGFHSLDVAANLEDRCGNSIARPFEVKMQERNAAKPSTTIAIQFRVK
ncbi:MAG: hypothetical protein AAF394_10560 [Planctomycetota bacterium]